ncbi:class F sortase [Kribbella sp. NPDC005582]|uniref:class F sortase n=1 Tax=Kribbella sp. NPDC005582 TaxID=3156893 RepID=UPI0033B8D37B
MPKAQHRGRPAPLRWGGSIVLAGIALAVGGGYLQLGDQAGAARPDPIGYDASPPVAVTPEAPVPQRAVPGATTARTSPAARPGRPLLLTIPRLHVSAAVLAIDTEDGALTPPPNPRTVGWWSDGALPGARLGSAVITGHTVHTGGGAFDDLEHLQAGDAVGVTTARGELGYRVTGVTTYRKQTLAKNAARIFDQSVPGRLVLITCEDWNGKVYLSNAVVVAQRVS